MVRVCGIDPGIANLGLCIADRDDEGNFTIVHLDKVSLFNMGETRYAYDSKQLCHLVYRFVLNREEIFRTVDLFLIENQMARAIFKVQFGLEALLQKYGKTLPMHPSTVKAFFKTSKKNYKGNKCAAVNFCQTQLEGGNLQKFRRFTQGTKADDVADAVLLAKYGALNYSRLMAVSLTAWDDAEHAARKKKKKRKRAAPSKKPPAAGRRQQT